MATDLYPFNHRNSVQFLFYVILTKKRHIWCSELCLGSYWIFSWWERRSVLFMHLWELNLLIILHDWCIKLFTLLHILASREDSWESLGLQGDPTSPSSRRSVLKVHWKDWCWSWNSSTLVTSFEELTHLKRPWCWERLKMEGEGDDRGWDGWMASPTQWTWVWVISRSWW